MHLSRTERHVGNGSRRVGVLLTGNAGAQGAAHDEACGSRPSEEHARPAAGEPRDIIDEALGTALLQPGRQATDSGLRLVQIADERSSGIGSAFGQSSDLLGQ